MKTKALLLTVALGAAGAATSMAQVYSQNAVGYINVTIPAGKIQMIANQLNSANMTLAALVPTAPDGATVYQFLPNGNYNISTYVEFASMWDPDPNISLAPGVGVFFLNPSASPLTLTFVGEVPQGNPLTTQVPANLSIRSSQVPQQGGLTSVLGYPPDDGDTCYQFNPVNGQYIINTYVGFATAWDPLEPNVAVGESFFIHNNTGATKAWNRVFTVN